MVGRKRRLSVDYFPHMVSHGRTLFILEQTFGNDGYAIFFKTLEILAGTDGHAYDFSIEEDWLYLCAKFKTGPEMAKSVLDMAVKLGSFDKELYQKKVLWSDHLIQNLLPVYLKRAQECPVKPISDPEMTISVSENTQSIAEHSRAEHSRAEGMQGDASLMSDPAQPATDHHPAEAKKSMTEAKEPKKRQRNGTAVNLMRLSEEEFFQALEKNPLYQGIDIRNLSAKMDVWCAANGKEPTRKRLINWLNRQDKQIAAGTGATESCKSKRAKSIIALEEWGNG